LITKELSLIFDCILDLFTLTTLFDGGYLIGKDRIGLGKLKSTSLAGSVRSGVRFDLHYGKEGRYAECGKETD
jgi:hypothetical protein